jgi:hypothetical protein
MISVGGDYRTGGFGMNNVVGLTLRGLAGAVVGGIVGYVASVWLARQGLYALVLPGAMLGLGCAVLLQRSSNLAGILCGIAALPLGLLCEWRIKPFIADSSLAYFVTHLHQLTTVTWIMVVIGAVFAFWLGKGSDAYYSQRRNGSAEK